MPAASAMKKTAAHTERRHERRVHVAVEVSFASAHQFYAGTTGDLSHGGVFLTTEDPPPPGTELRITIRLPHGRWVSADGTVRWVRPPEVATADCPAGCGVAWVTDDTVSAEAIRRFLRDLEQRGGPPR